MRERSARWHICCARACNWCSAIIVSRADPAAPAGLKDVATFAEHVTVAPIGYIREALFPAPGGVGEGGVTSSAGDQRGEQGLLQGRLSKHVCP